MMAHKCFNGWLISENRCSHLMRWRYERLFVFLDGTGFRFNTAVEFQRGVSHPFTELNQWPCSPINRLQWPLWCWNIHESCVEIKHIHSGIEILHFKLLIYCEKMLATKPEMPHKKQFHCREEWEKGKRLFLMRQWSEDSFESLNGNNSIASRHSLFARRAEKFLSMCCNLIPKWMAFVVPRKHFFYLEGEHNVNSSASKHVPHE